MNNNIHIETYRNCDTPSLDIIANAYHQRDLFMKIPFETVFENAMDKLCISEKSKMSLINNKFVLHCKNELKKDKDEYYFNKKEFIKINLESNQFKTLPLKFEKLKTFLDNKDHLGFYKALNVNELNDLGF